MKQASQPRQPGGITRAIILTLLVPLFVTVVGELLVEYLKPQHAATPKELQVSSGQQPEAQSETEGKIASSRNSPRHPAQNPKIRSTNFATSGEATRPGIMAKSARGFARAS